MSDLIKSLSLKNVCPYEAGVYEVTLTGFFSSKELGVLISKLSKIDGVKSSFLSVEEA